MLFFCFFISFSFYQDLRRIQGAAKSLKLHEKHEIHERFLLRRVTPCTARLYPRFFTSSMCSVLHPSCVVFCTPYFTYVFWRTLMYKPTILRPSSTSSYPLMKFSFTHASIMDFTLSLMSLFLARRVASLRASIPR